MVVAVFRDPMAQSSFWVGVQENNRHFSPRRMIMLSRQLIYLFFIGIAAFIL